MLSLMSYRIDHFHKCNSIFTINKLFVNHQLLLTIALRKRHLDVYDDFVVRKKAYFLRNAQNIVGCDQSWQLCRFLF